MDQRTLVWVSGGAASMVAAHLVLRYNPDALLVRCETGNEDEDNARFERDACKWLNAAVIVLKSDTYKDVPDVWERRKFMAGPQGAPCTMHMKVQPRLAFQRPSDVHVFGYTADASDVSRFERLQRTYFELKIRAPLIEAGITKAGTLAMIERVGIALPRTYAMGFPNANCLQTGCVKATSPDYWALLRLRFPDRFAVMVERSRRLGVRLARINDERVFIDEIPADWPVTQAIAPACDFLCHIAEQELEAA